jgi:hypothetical protein
MDHLRILADGARHRPIRGATSMSCYAALVRKELVKVDLLQGTIGFRISNAGRAVLARVPRVEGVPVILGAVKGASKP